MRTSIITIHLFICSISAFTQSITGVWNGAIKLSGDKKIYFVVNLQKNDTIFNTTVDIPTQRVSGIKAKSTMVKGDSLIFDLLNVGMMYRGRLQENRNTINGKM